MPITQFGFQTSPVSRSPEQLTSKNVDPYTVQTEAMQLPRSNGVQPSRHHETSTQWHMTSPSQPESRAELIRRIKRERKPLSLQDTPITPQPDSRTAEDVFPSLLPAVELRDGQSEQREERHGHDIPSQLEPSIERPRSALHSGDFWKGTTPLAEASRSPQDTEMHDLPRRSFGFLCTSPTSPWFTPRVPPLDTSIQHAIHDENQKPYDSGVLQARSRAASYSSLSSSFIFRPPTSPLAQQSNSNDVDDLDDPLRRNRSRSPTKNPRRRTFSPRALRPMDHPPPPSFRRGETIAYQAHQPRRSVTSFANLHSSSVPQTPLTRARKSSLSSELSPLHHAPMVGGYEESILRGRMSTLPSKPLDFVAQIGVLGKGNCKPQLRCPPHISVPFPAVFYNYGSQKGVSTSEDGPSPYVGLIELEDRPAGPSTPQHSQDISADDIAEQLKTPENVKINSENLTHSELGQRRIHRHRRVPSSSKAPKGAYRIPEQGQLQIVIKNPNKTAVKLFLVPYDLSGMEAGQKTFLRQRSYSAGPIIDMPQNARKNLGTDRPEASLSNSDDPKDRPMLRYLIHLHICCPCNGRYYLYKSIRVVFANRVPDGKEKLRNEIQIPEPRFGRYNPEQESSRRRRSSATLHPATRYDLASPPYHGESNDGHWINVPFANHEQFKDPFTFPKKTLPSERSRNFSALDSNSTADPASPWLEAVPIRESRHSPESQRASPDAGAIPTKDLDSSEQQNIDISPGLDNQQQQQGLLARQLRALTDSSMYSEIR